MEPVTSLIQRLVLVPLTLLPIINPLSGAPVFLSTAGGNPILYWGPAGCGYRLENASRC